MTSPAERVYEAAVGELAEQQARAGRFTAAAAPVAATATAGALLLKPATHAITHAQSPQLLGLVVGCVGLLVVFVFEIRLLRGPNLPGVPPNVLYRTARDDDTLDKPDPFHLAAAADLRPLWVENEAQNRRFGRWFTYLIIGLLLELAGLGAATLIRPNSTHPTTPPPGAASLHLTSARLSAKQMSLTGELAVAAHGRVLIAVSLAGRDGEVQLLRPSIHDGRFKARVRVGRRLVALRSASYTITWAGSRAVARAYLAGRIARCPRYCR